MLRGWWESGRALAEFVALIAAALGVVVLIVFWVRWAASTWVLW